MILTDWKGMKRIQEYVVFFRDRQKIYLYMLRVSKCKPNQVKCVAQVGEGGVEQNSERG